jgi:quinol monooxygenase YgiN
LFITGCFGKGDRFIDVIFACLTPTLMILRSLRCIVPLVFIFSSTFAQKDEQMVRLAILVIDSAQVNHYNSLLKEEIEASIAKEPGVRTLYAVADKKNPTRITILEIYANDEAYKKHIQTPHFLKYKSATKDMVKSLELVETVPLIPTMKIK